VGHKTTLRHYREVRSKFGRRVAIQSLVAVRRWKRAARRGLSAERFHGIRKGRL